MTDPEFGSADRNAAMRETVQQLLGTYRTQLSQLGEMREQLAQLSNQVTSPDRAITVTVDATGVVTKIEFQPSVFEKYTPTRLADTLTNVLRAAAGQVRQQAAEVARPSQVDVPDLADLIPGLPRLPELPTEVQPEPEAVQRPRRAPVPQDEDSASPVFRKEQW